MTPAPTQRATPLDTDIFSVAMSAVANLADGRDSSRSVVTRSSVEISRGDPVPVLLDRSRRAAVLVLPETAPGDDVVRVCFRFADCPLRLVRAGESG